MLKMSLHQLSSNSADRNELSRRMRKPQRHRLLHGYPLAAAMPRIPDVVREESSRFSFIPETDRGLLIGVLPHTFCNPKVRGCGFCTFPHETFGKIQAANVVQHVIQEIDQRLAEEPHLARRKVHGLYIGGGTANLTPAEPFRQLCRKLNASFDLSETEISLEGVPAYFLSRKTSLLDVMQEEIDARHFRISMGIQTFDRERLRQMGRDAFGDRGTVEEVVQQAHQKGMTVSGDLLFNLPWQSVKEMSDDVRLAVESGLDHLGLYHLVAFRGLGTEFSRDEHLLQGLPSNEQGQQNWSRLQEELLERGFVQTTLTNFEREGITGTAQRYLYEELSFQTQKYEVLGFGPSGISFASDREFRSAWKTMNPVSSAAYMKSVQAPGLTAEHYFQYAPSDLRILHLVRRLAALSIDCDEYRELFGAPLSRHFTREFEACAGAGLLEMCGREIRPTTRGMFYSDSISALFAWRRLSQLRHRSPDPDPENTTISGAPQVNENRYAHM